MPNRLANETSPYLLQHAHNPVDWFPWGPQAFARARDEDKPILLSIGYAACHWCHVMERESFEDRQTARLMNDWFVSIKVDREERPDLDSVYMTAVQMMTGQGGWPMTMFLTPDGKPFWGGTYFPPEPRHGMPSFRDVLNAIHDAWLNKREGIEQQGAQLTQAIASNAALRAPEQPPDGKIVAAAARQMLQQHDVEWGGFGTGMKFPQAMNLEFLLRAHVRGVPGALDALTRTLDRMARGGIFDFVGGGFHRYAVDRVWLVPHFEKMLYDNAQLVRVYARAYQVTGSALYRETAIATGEYLLREMRHPSGGFFSSQDADSEGVEGKFYVWPYDELIAVAGADMPAAIAMFAAAGHGNWEGVNVLWRPHADEEVAEDTGIAVPELRETIERVRGALFKARERRVRPATDDKILAAWNGLAIAGLAEAGRVLDRDDFVRAATDAAAFVLKEMNPHGRLQRSWRDGRTSGPGYLDDYAMMADACLTLYETTFEHRWWRAAVELGRAILDLFEDTVNGGFYDTGGDVPALLVRPKDLFDNAVPSGSSAAADALLRLAALSGDARFEDAAASVLGPLSDAMARSPLGFGAALCALDRYAGPIQEVAIVADPSDGGDLLRAVRDGYAPNRVVALGPPGSTEPPLLRDRPQRDALPTAYVCRRFACRMPVMTAEDLARELA